MPAFCLSPSPPKTILFVAPLPVVTTTPTHPANHSLPATTRRRAARAAGQPLRAARMDAVPPAPRCLTVRGARGDAMAVTLAGGPAAAPVALLVHGFRDSQHGRCVSAAAAALAAGGAWRPARMDCAGNGDSGGRFAFAGYAADAEDVAAVVAHLQGAEGVVVRAVVGHSKGGGAALIYAARYAARDGVAVVASLAARFDMRAGLEERFGSATLAAAREDGGTDVVLRDGFTFRLTRAALEEREALDMAAVGAAVPASVRVLLLHGAEDRVVPPADAHRHAGAITSATLCVIPGCDHNFTGHAHRLAAEMNRALAEIDVAPTYNPS